MSVLGRALRDFPFSADGVTVEDVKAGTERPFPPQNIFDGLRDAGFIEAVAVAVAPLVDEAPAAPAALASPIVPAAPAAEAVLAAAGENQSGASSATALGVAPVALVEPVVEASPAAAGQEAAPAAPAALETPAPAAAEAPAPAVAPASAPASKRRGRG